MSNFKKVDSNQKFPEMEKDIINFWEEHKIFEKSLENRKDSKEYTFYDGPPFATGTPHYGHLVGSIMKDVVPRYWTMRGHYVERKWGWDCHGLPIENIVEKELGSKKKKDIEAMGVDKFNEKCRSKVLFYVDEWKKVIKRLGRWADMENSYKTMDLDYMESVWWVFKELYDKGLIYEGYRSMHICTRCETTLSQQEVAEGYQDIKDLSATAKFELVDEPGTYVLAWTTTPWTLLGNVALAVGEDIDYAKVEHENSFYVLAKERLEQVFADKEYQVGKEFKGNELVGKEYKPLFDYYQGKGLDNEENGWKIYGADFVTTEEGTGVVHIAPAFGEDDLRLGQKEKLPFVQHVGLDGVIKEEAKDFAGLSVKPMTEEKDSHQKTDIEVIKYLAHNNLLFFKEKYEHSYPHCWRCDTPLINYATSSWFVAVEKIKEKALELAKGIEWSPSHMKEGRFGNWLEGARDWSISRQRFWASVMPIWVCDKCGEKKVFGSVKDLEEVSGEKIADIHKHIVDKVTFKCDKCEGEMKRVPDVLDTWFDSGSMPYAQKHYPFENEKRFEETFPADFIAEGVDQTRAWFYYLHIIAAGIKEKPAFKNVIVNGIVLAEDGKKMAKKLQNYPDPMLMFDKYGADSVRYYLMSSPVVAAQNLNFSESEVSEVVRGMMRMLWNSYSFFVLYANIDKLKVQSSKFKVGENLLDKWIVSELNVLIRDFNNHMENYELHKASRLFPKYVDNLSNWYIRRSRKRFWKSENDGDKNDAYATLHYVLVELSKVMAPFTPFIAEEIYRNLMSPHPNPLPEGEGAVSVHLADFPIHDEKLIDEKLNILMQNVRDIVNAGLEMRASEKIKVRQPLSYIETNCRGLELFEDIIKEELNVKEIRFVDIVDKSLVVRGLNVYSEPDDRTAEIDITRQVGLNVGITEDLKLEGQAREIIRNIQQMRKEADYEVDNRIKVYHSGMSEVFDKFGELIAKETLANEVLSQIPEKNDLEKEFEIENSKVKIAIKK